MPLRDNLLRDKRYVFFRLIWRCVNVVLAAAVASSVYAGVHEYSVRRYLRGFADAVVPKTASPEQKVEAILAWMRSGPARSIAAHPSELALRDPEITLNYQQLLRVCGTATNAFLNLARSGGLEVKRLLLLTPQGTSKHVVVEVLIDNRWVVVDPTFRVMLRDGQGRLLTRNDLKNTEIFKEAISTVPGYSGAYDYDLVAHVRLARLPFDGLGLRWALDRIDPRWDDDFDWSLLLERQSFLVLVISACLTVLFLLLRISLAWYADRKLRIPRYRLREHALRAGLAFFSTPGIEQ